jgi:hypothetical protein
MIVPGMTALEVAEDAGAGGWTVTVPPLELHAAVVAQYAK